MSLKAFHLIFVNALSALTFGCAIWKFVDYARADGTTGDLVFGLVSAGLGVAVIIYGRYFLKKLKKMSYL
jgi:hypothetical protein